MDSAEEVVNTAIRSLGVLDLRGLEKFEILQTETDVLWMDSLTKLVMIPTRHGDGWRGLVRDVANAIEVEVCQPRSADVHSQAIYCSGVDQVL